MSDDLNELYQEMILDHNRNPRNFGVLADANRKAEGNNPLCGDHFTVFLKLEDGVIKDVKFEGAGCAISKASASLMTEQLKGKTTAEAQTCFDGFQNMVTTGHGEEALGKLCVLSGVHKFPMRVKCAILSWHAMLAALKGEAIISTEKE